MQNSEKFGNSLKMKMKMTLKRKLFILIYHFLSKPHHFKAIENCYIKIYHVYLNDFNILF